MEGRTRASRGKPGGREEGKEGRDGRREGGSKLVGLNTHPARHRDLDANTVVRREKVLLLPDAIPQPLL